MLGGEGAHGVIILSPRAVARLESYEPAWPMPKIFRMTKGGKIIEGIFQGETINTPSMLCVEDYIDALLWAKELGGLKALMARADANAQVIFDSATRIPGSPIWREGRYAFQHFRLLKIVDPAVTALDAAGQADFAKGLVATLEKEGVAVDIGAYRDAPSGLRIWCGATIETSDLEALMPWLTFAFEKQKAGLAAKAA